MADRAISRLSNAPQNSFLPYAPDHLLNTQRDSTGIAEMVTYLPISSPFVRFAGRYVDDAFGVAAGYNFFVFEAILVPFEIVACNVIIHYWSDAVPAGGIIAIIIVCYGLVYHS